MERLRFGISTRGKEEVTEKDFEAYERAGLEELELAFSPQAYEAGVDWKMLKKQAGEHHIHLWSMHVAGMYYQWNPASFEKSIREHTIAYTGELIKRAADIGIQTMVMHSSLEPISEAERSEAIKNARDSLAQIAAIAAECGAVLAVENLPRTCLGRDSKEMKQLIAGDDRLRICFDTNHLLKQSAGEFILDVGNRIVTAHFSDCDRIGEKHWLPGDGVNDWKELMQALEQVGYMGPVIYEVECRSPLRRNEIGITWDCLRENHHLLKNKLL